MSTPPNAPCARFNGNATAPYTFVTTETFLAAFGMESLRDLPDPEQLDDAGLADPPGATEGLATGEASKGNRRPL